MAKGKERNTTQTFEKLARSKEITPIFTPNTTVLDMAHVPVLWGAFDPLLYSENIEKLLSLGAVRMGPVEVQRFERFLYGNRHLAERFFMTNDEWTDVEDNLATKFRLAGKTDLSATAQPGEIIENLSESYRNLTGDLVIFNRQHAITYLVHLALEAELVEGYDKIKIAEIVFDEHIDALGRDDLNGIPTSAGVYRTLTNMNAIVTSVIFGPSDSLIDRFTNIGGDRMVKSIILPRIEGTNSVVKQKVIEEVLRHLSKLGVTHVTFSVDLDVFAASEGVLAVRYSPIMQYLGLGCQRLPNNPTKEDLDALQRLKYPTHQVKYLLDERNIRDAQDLQFCRRFKHAAVSGNPVLKPEELVTEISSGAGLRVNEVLDMLNTLKTLLPKFGIQVGIKLVGGGRLCGTVVEMCGYEDSRKATSETGALLAKAITL